MCTGPTRISDWPGAILMAREGCFILRSATATKSGRTSAFRNSWSTALSGPWVLSKPEWQSALSDCGLRIADCGLKESRRREFCNPQSEIANPQSEIANPQSEIANPQSEI